MRRGSPGIPRLPGPGQYYVSPALGNLLRAGRRVRRPERDADNEGAKLLAGYQRLANVVVLVSLCVAGCGLAVSVVGGLNDRKRPFSLLRLGGVRLGTLRRVIALETSVPLLIVAAVAVGSGFLAAGLFLRSQMHYGLHAPGPGYYVMVLAGLAASLAVIASTMPLLRRITGPETARNE